MDGNVAASAFPAGLKAQAAVFNRRLIVNSSVALQAELPAFATNKEHVIRASVRVMACDASLHLHGRMLVHVRSRLIHMTCNAGFELWAIEVGAILRSVRIVAVCALHQTFGHAMMYRQRELSLNCSMTGETKLRLGLLQEAVAQPSSLVRNSWKLKEGCLSAGEISLALILVLRDKVSGMTVVA